MRGRRVPKYPVKVAKGFQFGRKDKIPLSFDLKPQSHVIYSVARTNSTSKDVDDTVWLRRLHEPYQARILKRR